MVMNRSTAICVSNSSEISRFRAASGVSPASIFPPGNSQPPCISPYPRCVANMRPTLSWIMAAETWIVFMRKSCLETESATAHSGGKNALIFFSKGNKMSCFSSAIPFHKKGKHLQFLKPEIDNWLKADNHTNK